MNGWPLYDISEEKQAFMNFDSDGEDPNAVGVENLEDVKGNEDPEEQEREGNALNVNAGIGQTAKAGEKWKNNLDIEFSDEEEDVPAKLPGEKLNKVSEDTGHLGGIFVGREDPIVLSVKKQSNTPGEFVAVGLFKEALEKLEKQIGMKSQKEISSQFFETFLSSEMFYTTMNFVRPQSQYITAGPSTSSPLVASNLKAAERKLQAAYGKTTEGNFEEAIVVFREILNSVPLMSLASKADLASAEKLIYLCTEYIVALSCDLEKKKPAEASPERQLELTTLMALPNLHPSHRVLTLRSAMAMSFKTKNFILSAFVARRFLKLCESNPDLVEADVIGQANKILSKSEKMATNEFASLKFEEAIFHDDNASNLIDCYDFKMLDKTQKTCSCPLTKARYAEKHKGKLCRISLTTEIGKEVIGMKIVK